MAAGWQSFGVMSVSERLTKALEKRGLSKEALEELTGLSAGYVSKLTRGVLGRRGPAPETIQKMAEALSVRHDWLATGNGPEPSWDDAPQPVEKDDRDPYPIRAEVLASNVKGYPKFVLEYVRGLQGYKGYATFTWNDWVTELVTAARRGGLEGVEQTEDDPSPPVRKKSKAKR